MATETPKLTRQRVKEIGETLRALPKRAPPDKELSKKEAVSILAPIIHKLLSTGYTMGQIGQVLKEAGMPLGASSLGAYLAEQGKAGDKADAKTRKRTTKSRAKHTPAQAQPSAPGAGSFEIRDRAKDL